MIELSFMFLPLVPALTADNQLIICDFNMKIFLLQSRHICPDHKMTVMYRAGVEGTHDILPSMKGASQESLDARFGAQASAQLILDVARAAGHLELAEVLESLVVVLKPTINIHAIAVFVIEGEYTRLHSLHVEGIDRKPDESVESVL